jgi:hypothetical protein
MAELYSKSKTWSLGAGQSSTALPVEEVSGFSVQVSVFRFQCSGFSVQVSVFSGYFYFA